MSLPAFQFYPKDWRNNAKLRRCSEAARGAWMDVLCLLHDSDEYGVLRWPLADIARAAGVPLRLVKELATKGVFKGADKHAPDYVWAPTHAGRQGEAVTLVKTGDGPCWYCSRFVRDAEIRRRRGKGTRFGDEDQGESEHPKRKPNQAPNGPPNPTFGDESGDGLAFASASASSSLGKSSEGGKEPTGAGAPAFLSPAGAATPSTVTDAQAGLAVQASVALRKLGMRCQPQDPCLLAMACEGFTVKEIALLAAEKSLRDAELWNDPDTDPELHELCASGGNQQQMRLTAKQFMAQRSAAAELGTKYVLNALRGRRRDAQQKAAENGAGRSGPAKPRASDNFQEKTYVGTAIDQLSPELRAAIAAEQSDD